MAEGELGWLVAGVTALVTLYKALAERNKTEADAGQAITAAALQLVTPLERRVELLEGERSELLQRVTEQERQIADLQCIVRTFTNGVLLLRQQLTAAGLTPIWAPGDPVRLI